jgi:hypothetical protein
MPDSTIISTLANLHSILAPVGKSSALTYKVHHKSFPDYITGSSCPSEFQILEKDYHLDLSKCCLKVMNEQLQFNICQVPSQDQYQDLSVLLKRHLKTDHISQELQYGVCNWAYHLSKVEEMDTALTGLLEVFSKEHLMHWMEVLAYINQLDLARMALKETAKKMVGEIYSAKIK